MPNEKNIIEYALHAYDTYNAFAEKVSGAAGYQICYSTSRKWKNKKQKLARNNMHTVK